MLQFLDRVTLNQLKCAGLKVYLKQSFFALSKMCSVELKFTIDLLVKWFFSINKMRFLEIEALTKQIYEKKTTALTEQKQITAPAILNCP